MSKKTTTPATVVETVPPDVNDIRVQRGKARWAEFGRRKPESEQDVVLCQKSEWKRIVAARKSLKRWCTISFPGGLVVAIQPLQPAPVSPAELRKLMASL